MITLNIQFKNLCTFAPLNHSTKKLRYFIEFAYKGTHYHGWQYQPNASSVQETLNKALNTLLRSEIEIVGAGRTDAGVHAKQMFAHFDWDASLQIPILVSKLNSFYPKTLSSSTFILFMMMLMPDLMLLNERTNIIFTLKKMFSKVTIHGTITIR